MTIEELSLVPAEDGVLLSLKVVPGSSRDEIRGVLADRLKVSVRAPPERGRANRSVMKLLESDLDLPRGSVRIVSGETTARKTALVRGCTVASLRSAIAQRLDRAAEGGGR